MLGDYLRASVQALPGSGVALLFGFVLLLWASLGFTKTAQVAMADVWGVPRRLRPGFWQLLGRSIWALGMLALPTALTATATVVSGELADTSPMSMVPGWVQATTGVAAAVLAATGLRRRHLRLAPAGLPGPHAQVGDHSGAGARHHRVQPVLDVAHGLRERPDLEPAGPSQPALRHHRLRHRPHLLDLPRRLRRAAGDRAERRAGPSPVPAVVVRRARARRSTARPSASGPGPRSSSRARSSRCASRKRPTTTRLYDSSTPSAGDEAPGDGVVDPGERRDPERR